MNGTIAPATDPAATAAAASAIENEPPTLRLARNASEPTVMPDIRRALSRSNSMTSQFGSNGISDGDSDAYARSPLSESGRDM
jgi:hypothetical protein